VLSELASKHPEVISVVHFTRNFGQLFAMIAAISAWPICAAADALNKFLQHTAS